MEVPLSGGRGQSAGRGSGDAFSSGGRGQVDDADNPV